MMASRWWTTLTRRVSDEAKQRHWLLLSCLLGAGGNSLLFYVIEPPGYEPVANLMAAVVFFTLALLVPVRRAAGDF